MEFLRAPVRTRLSHVDLVFRWAVDFVNPAKLFQFFAGLAEPAQNFSVQADFVDTAGERIQKAYST